LGTLTSSRGAAVKVCEATAAQRRLDLDGGEHDEKLDPAESENQTPQSSTVPISLPVPVPEPDSVSVPDSNSKKR
jgi:hypothetical protein